MKYFLFTAAASLALTSCATADNQCIGESETGGQPVDFGSVEAAAAHRRLPHFNASQGTEAYATKTIAAVTEALNKFDMSPAGETLFLRRRLTANESLLNNDAAKADVERLIALDRLHKNETPYLRAKLTELSERSDVNFDRQAQPLIRIPPIMSQGALRSDKSGHCKLEFDVSAIGVPENIRVGYCTDDVFRETSIDSVEKWKYNPAIRNGEAVARKNVVTNIQYKILDACGNLLPE